jgi:hypothetical protein
MEPAKLPEGERATAQIEDIIKSTRSAIASVDDLNRTLTALAKIGHLPDAERGAVRYRLRYCHRGLARIRRQKGRR